MFRLRVGDDLRRRDTAKGRTPVTGSAALRRPKDLLADQAAQHVLRHASIAVLNPIHHRCLTSLSTNHTKRLPRFRPTALAVGGSGPAACRCPPPRTSGDHACRQPAAPRGLVRRSRPACRWSAGHQGRPSWWSRSRLPVVGGVRARGGCGGSHRRLPVPPERRPTPPGTRGRAAAAWPQWKTRSTNASRLPRRRSICCSTVRDSSMRPPGAAFFLPRTYNEQSRSAQM